jgi:hypothetical protein
MDLQRIEDKIAQSFMQPLKMESCFITLEHLLNMNPSGSQLPPLGYDAIISLYLNEISLKRVHGDRARLYINVQAKMEALPSGKIIWERQESLISPEPLTIDYYKANMMHELNTILEKAGTNLSYDFIYLK